MKDNTILIIFSVIFMIGLVIGAAIFIARPPAGDQIIFMFKYAFIYIILTLIALLFLTVTLSINMRRLYREHSNMERLLFDIRDGGKSVFEEKRRTDRIYGEMGARIYTKDYEENCEVLNASHTGALLRCSRELQQNTVVRLKIYLPIFPQPIDANARVVRSTIKEEPRKPPTFDVAVEYTTISNIDREKLIETIDMLLEKQAKPK